MRDPVPTPNPTPPAGGAAPANGTMAPIAAAPANGAVPPANGAGGDPGTVPRHTLDSEKEKRRAVEAKLAEVEKDREEWQRKAFDAASRAAAAPAAPPPPDPDADLDDEERRLRQIERRTAAAEERAKATDASVQAQQLRSEVERLVGVAVSKDRESGMPACADAEEVMQAMAFNGDGRYGRTIEDVVKFVHNRNFKRIEEARKSDDERAKVAAAAAKTGAEPPGRMGAAIPPTPKDWNQVAPEDARREMKNLIVERLRARRAAANGG